MNLFEVLEKGEGDERFITLLERSDFKVEKIISYGVASPEDFWYEDEAVELVFLLEGNASVEFFDGRVVDLCKGMSLSIGSMCKHRVKSVSNPCIWLAIKYI